MRRIRASAEWALPTAVLAVIPKCPVCVAAYVLLVTGVSLSITAAAVLRWTAIGLCGAVLTALVIRLVRRVRISLRNN